MKLNLHLPLTYARCQSAFAKRRNDYKTLGKHVAPPPGVNSPALWIGS